MDHAKIRCDYEVNLGNTINTVKEICVKAFMITKYEPYLKARNITQEIKNGKRFLFFLQSWSIHSTIKKISQRH